ncbi:hypothetical protein pdam_00002620, partial [Pocillopora damicornis]
SIFIYPTQKFMIIWENYSGNKSSIQEKKLYLTTLLSCLPGFLLEEHSLQTQLADAWQGC